MLQARHSLATLTRGAEVMLLILAGLLGISQPISAAEGKFVNLSTRALVETGEQVMIGGFIIEGGPRQVLIQARGPELADDGVANALADPVLTIIQTSEGQPPRTELDPPIELMVKDNWEEDDQRQLISDLWGGNPNLRAGSLSSAAVLTLDPGGYTAKVEGKDGVTGVALVEVYRIDPAESEGKFVNLSTRALVETGEEVMIGGFIIEDGARRVLIQARGPELADDGVANALADPVLTIVQTSEGEPPRTELDPPIELMVNDNWEDSQRHLVTDFWGGNPPLTAGSLSSAAVLVLGPGSYTAKVEGKYRTAGGVSLVEVYGIDSSGVESTDYLALSALYSAANGANWANTINWLTDAPLGDWYGVTTDDAGRVIGIDLGENDLLGTIPSELGNLSNLQNLRLAHNRLSGPIPVELGNLVKLERLDLGYNRLSRPIPIELGNLANLRYLNLHFNRLGGPIPVKELGNLANLERLELSENQLSGPIPVELVNLANLRHLDLRGNQLSGPIPAELGNLVNLRYLNVRANQLSGPIPVELGNLPNLEWLDLVFNQLSGPIPAELVNLTSLRNLDLRHNQLSGPIPVELGRINSLESLALGNNQLRGPIPVELGNLPNLEWLDLSENELSGLIPSELGYLAKLERLWLYANQLSGPIPAELGNLANLNALRLYNNQLNGCIPRGLLYVGGSYPFTLGPFCGPSGPELVVTTSLSESDFGIIAGQSFTLSANILNFGEESSAATTVRFYLSSDATITPLDTEIGMGAVGELAASGTGQNSAFWYPRPSTAHVSINWTVPSSPGTYYFGACVDTVPDETDTTNNCSGSVQVVVE